MNTGLIMYPRNDRGYRIVIKVSLTLSDKSKVLLQVFTVLLKN